MQEICRTCGENIIGSTAKHLYDQTKKTLLQQIKLITGLWLENQKNMPPYICLQCLNKLKHAIEFREKCIKTQDYLINQKTYALRKPTPSKLNEHDPLTDSYVSCDDVEHIEELCSQTSCDDDSSRTLYEYNICLTEGPCLSRHENSEDLKFEIDDMHNLTEDKPKQIERKKTKKSKQSLTASKSEKNTLKRMQRWKDICEHCGLHFKTQEDLRLHIVQHKETDISIKYSNQKQNVTGNVKDVKQMVEETGNTPKKKRKCGKKTAITIENFATKKLQRWNDYLCDQCGIHFKSQGDLDLHLQRHINGTNCPDNDMSTEKKIEVTPQDCVDLDEDLASDVDISRYLMPSSGDVTKKRKKINWKSMSEEEAKALKQKLKNERNYYCTQCGKHFKDPGNYRVHLLRHTGIKKHECKTCNMKFYTASLMRRHELVHIKPYECNYCGQTFNYKSSKVRHEKLHTNDRPFKCNYCDKSFPSSTSYKNHELGHIGVRNFHCQLCDMGFLRDTHYMAHCRSKTHKDNEQKNSVS